MLLDFGGGGTSITAVDAATAFTVIGGTERHAEFAGDQIDQALLGHVLAGAGGQADPAQTAAVGSLTVLREACRAAKERLSAQTATELAVDVPGFRGAVRVTRAELEELIAAPLDGVFTALDDLLARNGISRDALTSVVLAGGGAAIPLVTQQFSQRLQIPVVTTPRPSLDAAVGAALFASYGRSADTSTMAAPGLAAPEETVQQPAAADVTYALAWSQDSPVEDVVPYTGGELPERPNP